VQQHSRVVAIDASPEVIAINRQRVQSDRVDYVVADVFAWQRHAQFDAVFFGFWLSHVPLEQFERFWIRSSGQFFLYGSLQPA
jgi:2-polyprenyl-3-methyl-5-hydroxy-6-metoxy-1,4-benzoquinol methylase